MRRSVQSAALSCCCAAAAAACTLCQDGAYYASWALTHWATLAASGLLCALAGMYPFRYSSLAVMVAFFWLFAAALVAASYFLATLFATSRVAGTATQLIYALSMIPG